MKGLIKHLKIISERAPESETHRNPSLANSISAELKAEIRRKYRALGPTVLAREMGLCVSVVKDVALYQSYGREPFEAGFRRV